jgi:DNA-binding CsgD family transcriptional regulator
MARAPDPWRAFATTFDAWIDALDAGPVDDLRALAQLTAVLTQLQAVRDHDLLELIAHGHTHAEIADALGVSRQAVGQQIQSARRREAARRDTATVTAEAIHTAQAVRIIRRKASR